jgi:hypothetical protein
VIDDLIDRADAFSTRWKTVISALSVAWFVATCADYAGFIKLPIELPLSEWLGFLPVVLWNALWWGVAYPRVEARRAVRNSMEDAHG